MNERRSDSVLKAGYMVKRSQNKKRFTPVNYKTRWFELTRLYLSYYDIGNLEVSAPVDSAWIPVSCSPPHMRDDPYHTIQLGHCMTLYPSDIHPHPLPLYCTSKATSNVSFVIQSTLI